MHGRKIGIEIFDKFNSVAHDEIEANEGIVVSSVGFDAGAEAAAKGYNLTMATLNPAATEDEHNFKIIREHQGEVNIHFCAFLEICPVSDEWSFQSVPVEHNENL